MEIPARVCERVLTKWHPEGDCWISDYMVGTHGYAQVGWSTKAATVVCWSMISESHTR